MIWDKKFISRWADRCTDIYFSKGKDVARAFAKAFFPSELLAEINKEIEARNKRAS